MSVNVNTVYNTVLSVLNKEQRGYLTPLEFENIAKQVQLEIFEKYFEDLNQFLRVPQTDIEYTSRIDNIDEKISIFKTSAKMTRVTSPMTHYTVPSIDIFGDTVSLYRLGTVEIDGIEAERISLNELMTINRSPLTKPTLDFPVFSYEKNMVILSPDPNTIYYKAVGGEDPSVVCHFVRKPKDPKWAYTADPIYGHYIYNSAGSVDFELHSSEQTELILKILVYAGVVIKDPNIVQSAMGLVQKQEMEQKS